MDRISIELATWESAIVPICTENVDLERAEKMLYEVMTKIRGYSDEEIKTYLSSEYGGREKDKFMSCLCAEEENIVCSCGGVYYEDME